MTEAFPLRWPSGRKRCNPQHRKAGKFNTRVWHAHATGGGWHSTVDISMAQAVKRLQEELDSIGARYPVISSNVELQLDGLPRSGQRNPDDPGCAVYFQLNGESVCLPCDTYSTVKSNIAAVAAHINATRAIERHGVATVAEMFSGFTALPAPKKWHEILDVNPSASREEIDRAYRAKAARCHPDRPGGSHDAMTAINAARDEAMRGLQ